MVVVPENLDRIVTSNVSSGTISLIELVSPPTVGFARRRGIHRAHICSRFHACDCRHPSWRGLPWAGLATSQRAQNMAASQVSLLAAGRKALTCHPTGRNLGGQRAGSPQ